MRAIHARPAALPLESRALVIWLAATILVPLAWTAWIAGGEPSGPACLLREVVHVDCPTCGITRALALIAHGEWRASLGVHPGAAALLLQALAGWIVWTHWLLRGGRNPERWIPHLVLANGAALIALWAVRFATGTLPH